MEKVIAPFNNLRFNDGPVNLLSNVEAMSAAVSTGDIVVRAMGGRRFQLHVEE